VKGICETLILWAIMLTILTSAWYVGSAKVETFVDAHPDVSVLTGS